MPSLLSRLLTDDFQERLRGIPMAPAAAQQIPLTPVTSSNLAAVGYDAAAQTLRVQFQSGHIHDYVEVPPSTWDAFQKATSKGSFYAREIRGTYVGEKMTGTCARCGDVGLRETSCTDCGTDYYQR